MDSDKIWNKQAVGSNGTHVTVLNPYRLMTPYEALVQAAWLVTLSELGTERFLEVLEAVQST